MSNLEKQMADIRRRQDQKLQESLLLQLQLPLWGETQRGVPNGLLRGALFGAIRRGRRPFLSRVRLPTVENTSIVYTGIRLSQDHLTLWGCLVHAVREQNLGDRCEVSSYQLLKLMGLKDTGGNRKVLYRHLSELQATAVEVQQGRYTYTGSLVDEAFRDEEAGRIVIVLNQRMIALFQGDAFTKIGWSIRLKLKKPLAKWLHGFYSSHRQPYPYTVAKIHELCGSDAKSLKDFETTLNGALEELSGVSAAVGVYFDYLVKGKRICVSHSPSIPLTCG